MNDYEIEIESIDLPYGRAEIRTLGDRFESAPGRYQAVIIREDEESAGEYSLGFFDAEIDARESVERTRKHQVELRRVETEKRLRLPRRRLGWEKIEGYPANEYRAPSIRPGFEYRVSLDYRIERRYFRNGRAKAEKISRFGWSVEEVALDERDRYVPGSVRVVYNRIEPGRNFDDYRYAIRAAEEDAAEYGAK